MTVPALVLLPSTELLPQGWHLLSPEAVTPAWWEAGSEPAPTPQPVPEAPAAASLGARVTASEVYGAQHRFVPRAPARSAVAAVIDALAGQTDGKLSLPAVASAAGRAGRRPEFFAAALQRLLNVDGYPVVSLIDGDRRLALDVELLRTQFTEDDDSASIVGPPEAARGAQRRGVEQ